MESGWNRLPFRGFLFLFIKSQSPINNQSVLASSWSVTKLISRQVNRCSVVWCHSCEQRHHCDIITCCCCWGSGWSWWSRRRWRRPGSPGSCWWRVRTAAGPCYLGPSAYLWVRGHRDHSSIVCLMYGFYCERTPGPELSGCRLLLFKSHLCNVNNQSQQLIRVHVWSVCAFKIMWIDHVISFQSCHRLAPLTCHRWCYGWKTLSPPEQVPSCMSHRQVRTRQSWMID